MRMKSFIWEGIEIFQLSKRFLVMFPNSIFFLAMHLSHFHINKMRYKENLLKISLDLDEQCSKRSYILTNF